VALQWGREGAPFCITLRGLVIPVAMPVAMKEESELRFEVNGQMFFVNFIPEEGRWYCFAPTATGLQKIPVSMDASPFEAYTVALDEQAKEVVN
jgi:hypothetical protein